MLPVFIFITGPIFSLNPNSWLFRLSSKCSSRSNWSHCKWRDCPAEIFVFCSSSYLNCIIMFEARIWRLLLVIVNEVRLLLKKVAEKNGQDNTLVSREWHHYLAIVCLFVCSIACMHSNCLGK